MESMALGEYFQLSADPPEGLASNYLVRIEHLLTINKQLNHAVVIDELFSTVLSAGQPLFNSNRTAVLMARPDHNIQIEKAAGLSEHFCELINGLPIQELIEKGSGPLLISDFDRKISDPSILKLFKREAICSAACIPFETVSGPGYFLALFFSTDFKPNKDDTHLAEVFADNLSTSLLRVQDLNRLAESESRFRAIINNSAEGIYQSSIDGQIIMANPSLVKMFGYSSADEMKKIKNTKDLYWDESERERLGRLVREKGQLQNYEVKMKRKDGSPIIVQFNDRVVKSASGEIVYYEGSLTDITERKKAELALLQSEIKYRKIFENVQDVYFQTDLSGTILSVSPSVKKVFDYSPEELIGRPIPPENYFAEDRAVLENLLQKNSALTDFEIRLRSKSGAIVYMSMSVHVIFDEQHKPVSIEGTLRDISVRKNAEQALHRQLSFAHALNHLAKIIIGEDDQNRILESMAKVGGETLNVDRSSIYAVDLKQRFGRGLCEWLNPESDGVHSTKADYPLSLFQSAEKYASQTHHWLESHANAVNPLFIKDHAADLLHEQMQIKSLLWFPLAFSKDGYFLLVFNQVKHFHEWSTEEVDFIKSIARLVEIAIMKIQMLNRQRKSAAELQQLATVVEQSSEAVVITNLDARIEYVNAAFTNITGYEAAEVLGENPRFLKSGRQSSEFFKAGWDRIKEGKVWIGKYINKRKDQSIYNEQAIIFPLKDATGNITKYCKIARDVTHEEELEERLKQAQKMEAVGALAGGIAHDFNNILMIINGRAALGLMTLDHKDQYERTLNSIIAAGKTAASMTKRLLAFSRKQVSKPGTLNLNTVIAEMSEMLAGIIGKRIKIIKRLAAHDIMIHADKSQIEQVLMNLMINARDAITEAGRAATKKRITIVTGKKYLDQDFVSSHPGSTIGEHVHFAVSDSGTGMDDKTMARIFEPFFTTKESGQGTGLGLATVYGIVSQNKGYIAVDSKPGKGSTFNIFWPAKAKKNN